MTYMPLDLRPLHSGAPCDHPAPKGLGVDAARQLILGALVPLNEAEQVPVGAVIGRIAADDVVSPVALPRFDNSAMDGYALHAADLAATGSLLIGGRVQAEAIFGRDTIVVSMPADTPFIPLNLATRLVEGLRDNTDAAFAISLDRSHHAIAAWPVRIRALIEEWLRRGETFAVKDFLCSRRAQPVDFAAAPHDPFFNVNTPHDLEKAQMIGAAAR